MGIFRGDGGEVAVARGEWSPSTEGGHWVEGYHQQDVPLVEISTSTTKIGIKLLVGTSTQYRQTVGRYR